MTRTVDEVPLVVADIIKAENDRLDALGVPYFNGMRIYDNKVINSVMADPKEVEALHAEILALRAERDTWREGARGVTAELAAVADALGARTDVLECARNIRAERDALRAAVKDAGVLIDDEWGGKNEGGYWEQKHAAVIARAREAAP